MYVPTFKGLGAQLLAGEPQGGAQHRATWRYEAQAQGLGDFGA